MRPWRLLPAAMLAATAVSVLAAQQPSFRAGVELVSLNVTVSDPSGRFITDLDQSAFEVYEDGVRQDISFFSRSNQPIALSLLLDTSASMEDKMRTAQEAAIGFARRLRAQDLAQVIDFDSRVTIAQPFTTSTGDLEVAIRRTAAGGSTALYNAVYIALKELKKIQASNPDEIRRQAIVVLSDGEDTTSMVSFEDVLEQAKRSGVVIYTVSLRKATDMPVEVLNHRRSAAEADYAMRMLASDTGGRSFFPSAADELKGIYAGIGRELAAQYALGYVPLNGVRDGAWRRVLVRIPRRPDVRPRTRSGYFAVEHPLTVRRRP